MQNTPYATGLLSFLAEPHSFIALLSVSENVFDLIKLRMPSVSPDAANSGKCACVGDVLVGFVDVARRILQTVVDSFGVDEAEDGRVTVLLEKVKSTP